MKFHQICLIVLFAFFAGFLCAHFVPTADAQSGPLHVQRLDVGRMQVDCVYYFAQGGVSCDW